MLTADEGECEEIIELFDSQGICCAVIGESNSSGKVHVYDQKQSAQFWDFHQQTFTGFNYAEILKLKAQSDPIEPIEKEAAYA